MQNKKLAAKNYYYIYGKHPVFSALNNPKRQIENILCTQMIFDENKKLMSSKPYKILTNDVLSELIENQNHQGIVAKVKPIFSYNIDDINIKSPKCKIAILDQITDPQNIGAIIRSAAAFEIDAIILPLDNSPNENGTIAKAACGTLELIPIIKVTNLNSCINYLKKHGFWIIGFTGDANDYFTDKLISDKIALVFGSEEKGIRRLVQENCDYLAKIPISDKVESLNVSNASSIIFHSLYSKYF
ncbi:MAG: 23S rRNA (guanosine(2251)-2'-O)-methyltransferase RlmB [Rickettsia endosymbiont of Argas persicus]